MEGRAHQGGQGGSPSADLQSPRDPGSRSQHPWTAGQAPSEAPSLHTHSAPLAFPGSSRTPTISWTSPPSEHSGLSSRVIPMLKILTGAKANRVAFASGGLPLGPHATRGRHTLYTRSFPNAPGGEESHTGRLAGHSSQANIQAKGLPQDKGLAGISTAGTRELSAPSRCAWMRTRPPESGRVLRGCLFGRAAR